MIFAFLELFSNVIYSVLYRSHFLETSLRQLDLITDLLGTPSLEAMRTACEGARAHILRGPHKQVRLMMDSRIKTTLHDINPDFPATDKWRRYSLHYGRRLPPPPCSVPCTPIPYSQSVRAHWGADILSSMFSFLTDESHSVKPSATSREYSLKSPRGYHLLAGPWTQFIFCQFVWESASKM